MKRIVGIMLIAVLLLLAGPIVAPEGGASLAVDYCMCCRYGNPGCCIPCYLQILWDTFGEWWVWL